MSVVGADGPSRGGPASVVSAEKGEWVAVCPLDRITMDRGVAVLVDGVQIAVFVLSDPSAPGTNREVRPTEPAEVYAIGNRDPYSGANVLARGIVGSVGDVPVVASPIYKQRFDLQSGHCLDGDHPVPTWPARVGAGHVEVAVVRRP